MPAKGETVPSELADGLAAAIVSFISNYVVECSANAMAADVTMAKGASRLVNVISLIPAASVLLPTLVIEILS